MNFIDKKSIIELLEERGDKGKELKKNLTKIRENAKPLLEQIIKVFPEYTPHNIDHKDRVLNNYKKIIPESLAKLMNDYELFFLGAATYLHDIGMVNFPELLKDVHIQKSGKKLQNYIRENHHIRTEKFIMTNFKSLGIENKSQAKIIGVIARGHRIENLLNLETYDPDTKYLDYTINLPLLASLLRISDELDFTFERIPMIIYEHITPKNKISKLEWERQVDTQGASPLEELPYIIKADVDCHNDKIHRTLKKLELNINKELMDLQYHLHHYDKVSVDIPRKFEFKITQHGYIAHDLKFTLEEKEIIKLLMGTQLYNRPEEALRELLKNAYDAIRMRQDKLKYEKLTLEPELIFQLSKNKKELEIIDNGIGMNIVTLEHYFTKIGRSFYNSKEFFEHEHDFSPVSELGIGILSCFMLADKLEIETKMEGSEPLQITIDDLSEYLIIKKSTKETTGTKIKLFLKHEVLDDIKLEENIRRFAVHLPFSIQIKSAEKTTNIKEISKEPKWAIIEYVKIRNPKPIIIEFKENDFEGKLGFLGKSDEVFGWLPLNYKDVDRKMYEISTSDEIVSIEGIYISDENPFSWISDTYTFLDINFKNRPVDLNAARNEIIFNNKFFRISEDIAKIVSEKLISIIQNLEKIGRKEKTDYQQHINNILSNYIQFTKRSPESIKNIFEKYMIVECYTKKGICKFRYPQIKKFKNFIVFKNSDRINPQHMIQIIKTCKNFKSDTIYRIGYHTFDDYMRLTFNEVEEDLTDYLEYTKINKLSNILNSDTIVAKFENFKTDAFVIPFEKYADMNEHKLLLNIDHKFVKLLIKGERIINAERKIILDVFVRNAGYRFNTPEQTQIVLSWFVDAKIIKQNECPQYYVS